MSDDVKNDFVESSQKDKKYLIHLYGQDYYSLSELIDMSKRFLARRFLVTDLSVSEGVILKRCVDRESRRYEKEIQENVSKEWLIEPAQEAACSFLIEAYGLPVNDIMKFIAGQPGCWELAVWLECTRDNAHSNGLNSTPLLNRHFDRQMKLGF